GPERPGLVARWPSVAGRQGSHEQVVVALVPGRGGLGGPDRVQQSQVIGVGQGLVAGLGGREQLAVVAHVERRLGFPRREAVAARGAPMVTPGYAGSLAAAPCR